MNKPKFRAWDKVDCKMRMIEELCFDSECVTLEDFLNGKKWHSIVRNFEEVILMQYTGLKDKNGVEIFEGDVVKQTAGEYSYVGAVEKDCYQFYIDGINPFDSYSFDDVADTSNCTADLVIIGNIHENPELLSGVEK